MRMGRPSYGHASMTSLMMSDAEISRRSTCMERNTCVVPYSNLARERSRSTCQKAQAGVHGQEGLLTRAVNL
jgi:hypothetical protein